MAFRSSVRVRSGVVEGVSKEHLQRVPTLLSPLRRLGKAQFYRKSLIIVYLLHSLSHFPVPSDMLRQERHDRRA